MMSGVDREQAALQGAGEACGCDVAHQAGGRGRQGGEARGLVGQEASQEQGHGGFPAGGASRGGHPTGRHASHPRSHGLRQRPQNHHHASSSSASSFVTAALVC